MSISPARPDERTAQLERPVTIKLLPDAIAQRPELAGPFVEAAKAVAELRHPNLPTLHEVAHGAGHLYLVMEYVKGETVAAVLRALQQRGETLDFTLAAHIIAEAAAGLHAAHQRGILHEQLTPHDIFVSYDGSVRVLDVGIAAARSRALGELGTRAKLVLQYSSPERCRKEPLDAQTDVFSLGALLWELNTSISPFERAKEEDTIKAICDEPMVSPSVAFRGLPEHVSRITMQALARLPIKRYPTALALHDALRASVKLLGMGSSPQKDLAGVMSSLFEARIRDKDEAMVRILAGKPLDGLDIGEPEEDRAAARVTAPPAPPAHPLDPEPKEPSVIIAPSSDPAVAPAPDGEPETAAPVATPEIEELPVTRSPSRRVYGIVAAVIALALVVCLVAFAAKKDDANGATRTATSPSTARSATIPPPSVTGSVTPTESPSATPVASATPATAASVDELDAPVVPQPAITGDETVIHIETVPPRAAIFVGGEKRGVSPMDLRLPKGTTPVVVELKRLGFQTLREKLVPDQNQKLRLTLVAAPHGPGPGPTTTGGTSTANPYHKFQ